MARISRIVGAIAIVVLLVLAFGAGWLTGTLGYGAEVDPASLTDLERQFAEQMRGARMVGRFTLDGREDQPARPDEYVIESVEKVGDDRWRFTSRIGYGGSDVSVPLVVTMRWIGDTPMMMLTDFEVPSMGTFTVRLFYYGDRYAGTWANERGAGGHMFGRIERAGD
jgi:hypothetical protein